MAAAEPDDLSFTVEEHEAGERLDRTIAARLGIARNRLTVSALAVDGAPAHEKDRPRYGAVVRASVVDRAAAAPVAAAAELDVVVEDPDFIVVDKAAGVAVHPPAGSPERGGTLVNTLLDRYPEISALGADGANERPGIVHRIDRDTSGLLVVARSDAALAGLREQVAAHTMRREYAALVTGVFDAPSGMVDAPIGRKPGAKKLSIDTAGRHAVTRYAVEAGWSRPPLTVLTATLETGRTHQIRVHLQAIGHPVVGDRIYGGSTSLGSRRQWLHARRLAFAHPLTQAPIDVTSALPADLREVLDQAGHPDSGAIPPEWSVSTSSTG